MTDQNRQADTSDKPVQPVNVIDGIPDRSDAPAAWKYVALGLIFLAWLGFLVYCHLAGNVET